MIEEETFKDIFYRSPIGMYTCDKDGHLTEFNDACVELWGRKPAKGESWCGSWKTYYPDGRPMPPDERPMAKTLKQNRSFSGVEILVERPDHTFKNILVYPKPILDNNGILTGAWNTLVDITDQRPEIAKQGMLSAIVESSDDAIISKNLNGMITSWNKGAQKIFEYTEAEVLGKHISLLIPTALLSEEEHIISNIRRGNKIDHFKTLRLTKSGRLLNISLTVSPIKDHRGNIIGASKIARDVTEDIHKEQIILQNTRRLEILNAISSNITGTLDEQQILQLIIDATTRITNAAGGAFFYKALHDDGDLYTQYAFSGDAKEAFEKHGLLRNTATTYETFPGTGIIRSDNVKKDPRYGEHTFLHSMFDGYLPLVSYLALPVTNISGSVIGGLFFNHPEPAKFTEEHEDIVKIIASQASVALDNCRLFAEVKLLSEKKDEFIALASHELKTPLTTVNGYLQILQAQVHGEDKKIFVDRSLRQVQKLNTLISELLDVSRIEAGKLLFTFETFNLKELLLEIVETYKYSSRTHVIIFEEEGDNFDVEADKQRIEQVIVNLVTNAIKYSVGANAIFINLRSDNDGVTVKVKDEGVGLSEHDQEKIFTRFYRVDSNTNISGLGLGLFISNEIIKRHHSTIHVKSELQKGSEFWFTLPRKKV